MTTCPNFPLSRAETAPLLPASVLSEMRLEGPIAKVVLWDASEAWLVTRSKDVRSVLLDKRFSESPTTPGYPSFSPARKALVNGAYKLLPQTQGDEHARARRACARELSVKRIEAQRPVVRQIVNELIDEMIASGSPYELVQNFALAVPMKAISNMLGIPYEDHEFFEQNSQARVALDVAPEVPLEATRQMAEYFDKLLREREENVTDADDILSRFARDHIATGALTHDEAVNIAYQLVQGGHETTGNMIALGTLLLMQNPDQLKALMEDPTLVKSAVEEMLRYTTVLQHGMARVALEDVEIDGAVIRKGDALFAMIIGANHDPAVFPNPEKFDIHRNDRNHVAFSYGVHQCVGQQLARMEMQEVFSILFQRLPNLRLAVPFEELKFKSRNVVFGIEKLTVTW